MRSFQTFSLIVTLLMASGFSSATLADRIFMYFDGVQGEVTEPGFVGRTELDSFQWGFGRNITLGGGGGSIGPPVASEVSLSKGADGSSAGLAAKFLSTSPSNVIISFTKLGTFEEESVRVELCQAFISSISSSAAGGGLYESVSVAFESFKLTYFEVNGKGGGAGDSVQWDFATQTAGSCSVTPI